jgi:CBS domain-containing protein
MMKISETIDQVMRHKSFNKIIALDPEQTVYEALKTMEEYDVGALMVFSGRHLVGILSERDYARKGVLRGHHSKDTKVREIMTSPVVSVNPNSTVDECMNLMSDRHFRHLPVVEDDNVVGIISIGDLVRWVISGHEQHIQALEGYITGAYPG